ncbi:MAG: hypothetical protein ACF8R7_12620 [Phycisphaerales bacterium JB039]
MRSVGAAAFPDSSLCWISSALRLASRRFVVFRLVTVQLPSTSW